MASRKIVEPPTAAVEESLFSINIKNDGTMKIDRVLSRNGVIQKRETFADDMADICLDKLERHLRHARLTGIQP